MSSRVTTCRGNYPDDVPRRSNAPTADDRVQPGPTQVQGLPPDLEIFTVEEAAVFLRVAPQTVRNELAAGRLPGRKIGKSYRLSREALIRWLDQPAERRAPNKRRRTVRASNSTGGSSKG